MCTEVGAASVHVMAAESHTHIHGDPPSYTKAGWVSMGMRGWEVTATNPAGWVDKEQLPKELEKQEMWLQGLLCPSLLWFPLLATFALHGRAFSPVHVWLCCLCAQHGSEAAAACRS